MSIDDCIILHTTMLSLYIYILYTYVYIYIYIFVGVYIIVDPLGLQFYRRQKTGKLGVFHFTDPKLF